MNLTLNAIRQRGVTEKNWQALLALLGKTDSDDEPLNLTKILEANGYEDALLCLKLVKGFNKEKILYAVWVARQVQHLMEDPRSVEVLDITERYAQGLATNYEFIEALAAARSAAKKYSWETLDGIQHSWDAAEAAAWSAVWAAAWAATVEDPNTETWDHEWNGAFDAEAGYARPNSEWAATVRAALEATNCAARTFAWNIEFPLSNDDESDALADLLDLLNPRELSDGGQRTVDRALEEAKAAQVLELQRVCECVNAGIDAYPNGTFDALT